ncbi:MAG: 50S ribosomal protein L38e [Candidatus Helarchaeota archaeon]|nr:50S ribosomal protein L38e [Candidatus Helarchaeota archaeon]
MPKELKDVMKFIELSNDASECRVKRIKDVVKLKLRTIKYLYTLKLEPENAEEIIKKIKCQVIEI